MVTQEVFRGTSAPLREKVVPAVLTLEDGRVFKGISSGAVATVEAEIVIDTSLIGYQRSICKEENRGRIILFTYPQIGNYGIVDEDIAPGVTIAGLIARSLCYTPSNYRMDRSLPELLVAEGIPAIEDIDTRELVQHIRQAGGHMRATLSVAEGSVE